MCSSGTDTDEGVLLMMDVGVFMAVLVGGGMRGYVGFGVGWIG